MTVKAFHDFIIRNDFKKDIVFKIRGSDKKICFSFDDPKIYSNTKDETIIEVQLPNKIVVVE